MKVFKQQRYFTSKIVEFKEDGIDYYSGNALNSREIFISYDEILVNNITRETRTSKLLLWVTLILGIALVLYIVGILLKPEIFNNTFLPIMGVVFISSVIATLLGKKQMLYVATFNGLLIDFFDKKPSEEKLDEFLNELKVHTNNYLKEKYATIDLDLPIDKQLENLKFLKLRKVITEKEYQQLKEKLKNVQPDVKGFKY